NPKHRFNYGISGKLYNIMPGQIEPLGGNSIVRPLKLDTERGLEGAVYIEDSYNVTDKWLLNMGIRYSVFGALGGRTQNIYEPGVPRRLSTIVERREYDDTEFIKTYGGPELRLSSRYLLTRDLSVKLSYNNTYQYIHSLSNNTTASPTDTYKLSDVNIAPQRASQYSLGFYQNLDNNTYELSLEGFYKTSNNILDYKVGAEMFLNEAIETEVLQGEGRAYGAEFLLKKTIGKLNGWLGYTYSRSLIKLDSEFQQERVNNGEYFPSNFDKPHDLSVVANYRVTKRFSFSANFVYQTGRPVTVPVGKFVEGGAHYVLYSNRNEYRIPDYYRLDLSFNVEGDHRIKKFAHSFWNISVYNVLGRNNPYSVFFITEGGEVKAYQSSIFAIPVPTITYNFRF
ncbi:MAG TPA: TonB-dependent receptor, partial [Gillisia sp.]|nr:TonB-dependent receptor [Gillisia sp.]